MASTRRRGRVRGGGAAGRRLRRDASGHKPRPRRRQHQGPRPRDRPGEGDGEGEGHRPRLGSHHRIAPARPGRVLVRHRQLAGAGQRQRPLPCAGHRRCLRRLRGDGRELVVLAGLPRRLPGLVLRQQCAGRHQLHQVRSGHRHRGLLVHGRTRRRPWLQRYRRRGRRLGRAAGGADAGQHGQGARHLPGRVHGYRTAGGGARIRQRLGGRLQLAVQRAGKAPRHALGAEPGRLQRVLALHRHSLRLQGRGLLRPGDLDADLRHRQRRLDPAHLRVDLRTGDRQPGAGPAGLVPEVGRLRGVLRRRHYIEPLRSDVAVVGWRRRQERDRRFRPDRCQQAGLSRRAGARAGCRGARAGPGPAATCH